MTAGSRKLYNGTTTVHLTLTVYKYKTYTEGKLRLNTKAVVYENSFLYWSFLTKSNNSFLVEVLTHICGCC